jgi:glutathione S-transferase
MMVQRVVLWHLPVSHYNEKVRWALAYKDVPHERRTPPPALYMAVALWLTRGTGNTLPVLRINQETVGDSTEIIAALERRFREPPLYPSDPDERRRALELEDFFDEEVAPHVRLLAWHEVTKDRERFAEFAASMATGPLRGAKRAAGAYGRAFLNLRYGVHSDESAELARCKVEAAFDRLEAELGSSEYLVGDRFTVADLTAASILYPIVRPPEGPQVMPHYPGPLERFRLSFSDRPGYRWVAEMFRRHRRPEPAPRTATVAAAHA